MIYNKQAGLSTRIQATILFPLWVRLALEKKKPIYSLAVLFTIQHTKSLALTPKTISKIWYAPTVYTAAWDCSCMHTWRPNLLLVQQVSYVSRQPTLQGDHQKSTATQDSSPVVHGRQTWERHQHRHTPTHLTQVPDEATPPSRFLWLQQIMGYTTRYS